VSKPDSKDQISYSIVIRGIESDAFELTATRFNCRRGGVNPRDSAVYISVPLELDAIEPGLAWIKDSLGGKYTSIVVGVSVYTERNWSNLMISPALIKAVATHGVELKICFASPACTP